MILLIAYRMPPEKYHPGGTRVVIHFVDSQEKFDEMSEKIIEDITKRGYQDPMIDALEDDVSEEALLKKAADMRITINEIYQESLNTVENEPEWEEHETS